MDKYVCTACMYVYDPAEHDNIPFEELPEDYVCPVCAVGKEMFEKQQEYFKKRKEENYGKICLYSMRIHL